MPQKRNPVVLEHLRARLSRLIGLAQTVITQCRNIAYSNTQDIEDEIEPTLFAAIERVTGYTPLNDDMYEILEAVKKDNEL